MDELDFTGPARSADAPKPDFARQCFESLGKSEEFAEGALIFKEGQAADRMYFLVAGEITLVRAGKTLDIVSSGEIFGEVAAVTEQSRSASAVARKACRVLSLDVNQFRQSVQATPEFALLLMGVLNNRLRLTVALLGRNRSLASAESREEKAVFSKRELEELASAMRARPPQTYPAGRAVMKEGDAGVYMYVVLRGKLSISIQGTTVGQVNSGGVVGEMALVDQSPRAASATADMESVLLQVSRADFLNLVKTNPGFAVALIKATAGRLRHMTAQQK
ncbi:MAG: cyclic nucleotide-binding domain-containing protein [Burkholderiales bacterium]